MISNIEIKELCNKLKEHFDDEINIMKIIKFDSACLEESETINIAFRNESFIFVIPACTSIEKTTNDVTFKYFSDLLNEQN